MMNVQEIPEVSVRDDVALLFAKGEHRRAVDKIIELLNKNQGNCEKSIWFMLMDCYQAMNQQEAFEKSAYLFASFFKTSPPSWVSWEVERESATSGSEALVVDNRPSMIRPNKLTSFIASAKKEGLARLDLSRVKLDEDYVERVDDLKALLNVMRRLRRYKVKTLLMGENKLVEIIKVDIESKKIIHSEDVFWETLLEFLQWRGLEDEYEDMAIQYSQHFRKSAPGYEFDGAVAITPQEKEEKGLYQQELLSRNVDENEIKAWISSLSIPKMSDNLLHLDFKNVHSMSYEASVALAMKMKDWDLPKAQISIIEPNELVLALFEITGVAEQGSVLNRKR